MKPIYNQIISTWLVITATFHYSNAQERTISLREAYKIAAKENRQILASRIEELKAASAIDEAKSSLSPNVSAIGNYSFFTEKPVIFLRKDNGPDVVQATKVGGRNSLSAAVVATYPIINPVAQSKIRLARIDQQFQKVKTQDVESEIAYEIGKKYFDVLLYNEQLTLLKQSVQRNEQSLRDSRSLFLQGKSLKTDTLQNYISVQNLNASISALENSIRVQLLQLKQLLALDDTNTIVLTDTLSHVLNYELSHTKSALEEVALNNRNDLKTHLLRIDRGKEELEGVKSEFKPHLSAVGAYQLQAQSDKFSIWNYNLPRTSFVGLQLSVPIYSGKRKQSKMMQQQYARQQDEILLADLKGKIKTELNSLQSKIQEAYNQNNIQKQNVNAASISYTMIRDRYQHGMSTRLELADAELALTQAKINDLESIYTIRVLELQLEKALGVLSLK